MVSYSFSTKNVSLILMSWPPVRLDKLAIEVIFGHLGETLVGASG